MPVRNTVYNPDDPSTWPATAPPPASTTAPSPGTMTGTGPGGATAASGVQQLWAQSGKDPAKFVAAYIAANNLQADQMNPRALQSIVDALNSVSPGSAALDTPDAQGRLEGIKLNGTSMQLIGGNGWTPLQPWGADTAQGGSLGSLAMGSLTAPYGQTFTPPTLSVNGQKPTSLPGYTPPPAFVAPTLQDAMNAPGGQFALQQGEQALEQSAAGRGTLNTGGTLKDILGYGQNLASQQYGNLYNQAANTYATNYQSQYLDPYKNAYQAALDAANFNYGGAATAFNTNYQIYRNQQNDNFNKVFSVANA